VLEQPKGTKEVMAKKKPRRAAGGRKQGRVRSKKSPMRKAKRAGAARSTAPKRKAAKKKASASRRAAKARPRKATAAAPTRKAAAAKTRRPAGKAKARSKAATAAASPRAVRTASRRPANLDRERRTVTEDVVVPTPPSSLSLDRSASAARSGRAEMNHRFREHTSTGPAMTAGDVDADWESAESVGDEAPGGDNPTPDQDVVDEIGKALGVEYDDDEELQGGEEITERDRNRWELDPASRDDFDDRED
jgi:hypothetical protein